MNKKNYIFSGKKILFIIVFSQFIFLFPTTSFSQSNNAIGINNDNPNSASILDIKSENRGILIPRIGATSLSENADGLLFYSTYNHKFAYFDSVNNSWQCINPWYADKDDSFISISKDVEITGATSDLTVGNDLTVSNDLNVSNNVDAKNITASTQVTANNFVGYGITPIGGIIMWSGDGDIPDGWALCNGQNSTPDLRGRFVVGITNSDTSNYGYTNDQKNNSEYNTIGNTGGEKKHTLIKSEIPKHKHDKGTLHITSSGAHTHTTNAGKRSGESANGSGKHVQDNEADLATISGNGAHTHPNSSFAGNTGDGSADGLKGESHENRPPYYVIAYIMRVK